MVQLLSRKPQYILCACRLCRRLVLANVAEFDDLTILVTID